MNPALEDQIAQLNNLAKNLKDIRLQNGLTQSDLAQACCISTFTVRRIENPQSNFCPQLDTIFKLAWFFNVPIAELFVEHNRDVRLLLGGAPSPQPQATLLYKKVNKAHNEEEL